MSAPNQHLRFALEQVNVCISSWLPELEPAIGATFSDVIRPNRSKSLNGREISGFIRPFDGDRVLSALPPTARLVPTNDPPLDLFIQDPMLWLVDDAWGIAAIDPIKMRWDAWVLPGASRDPMACVGRAIALPLACLLARRGLALVEAAAVTRGGHTALLIAPFPIADELAELLRAGFGLIGAHRVLLRERSDIIETIHFGGPAPAAMGHRDLSAEFCGSTIAGARCDVTLLIDPARRRLTRMTRLAPADATGLIRRSLTLPDVPELALLSRLPVKLARATPAYRVQLGQHPAGLRDLLLQIHRVESPRLQMSTFVKPLAPVAA